MIPFNPKFGLQFSTSELEELWTLLTDEKEIRVRHQWQPEGQDASESGSEASLSPG